MTEIGSTPLVMASNDIPRGNPPEVAPGKDFESFMAQSPKAAEPEKVETSANAVVQGGLAIGNYMKQLKDLNGQ